jgi:hypothetical protein
MTPIATDSAVNSVEVVFDIDSETAVRKRLTKLVRGKRLGVSPTPRGDKTRQRLAFTVVLANLTV